MFASNAGLPQPISWTKNSSPRAMSLIATGRSGSVAGAEDLAVSSSSGGRAQVSVKNTSDAIAVRDGITQPRTHRQRTFFVGLNMVSTRCVEGFSAVLMQFLASPLSSPLHQNSRFSNVDAQTVCNSLDAWIPARGENARVPLCIQPAWLHPRPGGIRGSIMNGARDYQTRTESDQLTSPPCCPVSNCPCDRFSSAVSCA